MSGSFSRIGPAAPIEARPDFRVPLILPSKPLDTVQIVSDETESGFVIINASDFDPSVHVKYAPDAASEAPKKSRKAAA